MKTPTIQVARDKEALAHVVAEHVVMVATDSVSARGLFTIALAGGSTPEPVYRKLAREEFSSRIDWKRAQIFWGDERCVPPDDSESNYRMARAALLDHVLLPAENIHRICGEIEPDHAASEYARELENIFGGDTTRGGSPPDGFDLVLLGMGDDGHTASLFPLQPAVTEQKRWVMAQRPDGATLWRITLTPVVINAAKNIAFIVSGEDKAPRVKEVLHGTRQPSKLPAQAIMPTSGEIVWFLDKAAAVSLSDKN